jgi:branched-chain amino acid transport system substrate-binding protein
MRSDSTRAWYRWPLIAAAVAALTLFAVACGDDDDDGDDGDTTPGATSAATTAATQPAAGGGTITINAGDSIKIGISSTLSTDNAELGIPIRDAALLAIGERPDIEGFTIEAVEADDLCSGPGSEAAAQQLISEGVVAVLGPMCSGGAVAALDDYGAENILVISGSATNTSVTAQGATNFARTAWNDDVQGEEMAKYVFNELGFTKAVLVNDQSTYGQGLMAVFKASFEELGGTATDQTVTVGEQDFSAVVTTITGESPEIVVFGGFIAEGAALVRQLRDAGFEGAFMGADGIADQDFIDQAGDAAEGAYVSRGPQALQTNFDEFIAKYTAEYGEDAGTQFTDFTYDAVNIILNAIEQVATVDSDGNLVIDKDDLIAAAKGITLENGATGTVEFLDNGDRDLAVGAVNRIDQVTNGALEQIQ